MLAGSEQYGFLHELGRHVSRNGGLPTVDCRVAAIPASRDDAAAQGGLYDRQTPAKLTARSHSCRDGVDVEEGPNESRRPGGGEEFPGPKSLWVSLQRDVHACP
jgi:hypothetical protein